MKVLVTGAAGYIGSVLVRLLIDDRHEVIGLDNLSWGAESVQELITHPLFELIEEDIRNNDSIEKIIQGVKPDAIVHLAAIVGDPACKKFSDDAKEINLVASKKLVDLADEAGVDKFIFASTCSNYGKMDGVDIVDENSKLSPVSLYAETKVEFEEYLRNKSFSKTSPCILRFSTVYGKSSRMRFDLTVNEFSRDLYLGKELEIYGPQFWRPYCHVDDLARSVIYVLNADNSSVNKEVFNVGDTKENYQKGMIVKEIQEIVKDAKIKYVDKTEDPRDYRVDFTKISEILNFEITKTVPDGIKEVIELIDTEEITNPYDPKYSNI